MTITKDYTNQENPSTSSFEASKRNQTTSNQ